MNILSTLKAIQILVSQPARGRRFVGPPNTIDLQPTDSAFASTGQNNLTPPTGAPYSNAGAPSRSIHFDLSKTFAILCSYESGRHSFRQFSATAEPTESHQSPVSQCYRISAFVDGPSDPAIERLSSELADRLGLPVRGHVGGRRFVS